MTRLADHQWARIEGAQCSKCYQNTLDITKVWQDNYPQENSHLDNFSLDNIPWQSPPRQFQTWRIPPSIMPPPIKFLKVRVRIKCRVVMQITANEKATMYSRKSGWKAQTDGNNLSYNWGITNLFIYFFLQLLNFSIKTVDLQSSFEFQLVVIKLLLQHLPPFTR